MTDRLQAIVSAADQTLLRETMRELAEKFKGQHMNLLEIGCCYGGTAEDSIMLLEELGADFSYYAIDIGSIGGVPKVASEKFTFVKDFSFTPKAFAQIPRLHWAFIDGCHCEECAITDALLYSYKVIAGGFVGFHDAYMVRIGTQGQDYPESKEIHSHKSAMNGVQVREAIDKFDLARLGLSLKIAAAPERGLYLETYEKTR